jgi:hypothetical protein
MRRKNPDQQNHLESNLLNPPSFKTPQPLSSQSNLPNSPQFSSQNSQYLQYNFPNFKFDSSNSQFTSPNSQSGLPNFQSNFTNFQSNFPNSQFSLPNSQYHQHNLSSSHQFVPSFSPSQQIQNNKDFQTSLSPQYENPSAHMEGLSKQSQPYSSNQFVNTPFSLGTTSQMQNLDSTTNFEKGTSSVMSEEVSIVFILSLFV